MFFVVEINGRTTLLSAETIQQLQEQCNDIDSSDSGIYIGHERLTGKLFSSLSSDYVAINLRPQIVATTLPQVAATIVSPTIAAQPVHDSVASRRLESAQKRALQAFTEYQNAENLKNIKDAEVHVPSRSRGAAVCSGAIEPLEAYEQQVDHQRERYPSPSTTMQSKRQQVTNDNMTKSEALRYSTLADLRIEILHRLTMNDVDTKGFHLHIIRSDTRELITNGESFESFRDALHSSTEASSEHVVLWRLATADVEQQQQKSLRNLAIQPIPVVETSFQSAQPRIRGQIRVRTNLQDHGFIFIDRRFPPSFWLLRQQLSYHTGIPDSHIEVNVCSDTFGDILIVQSDHDVRAVCLMMEHTDPTLVLVDTRMY